MIIDIICLICLITSRVIDIINGLGFTGESINDRGVHKRRLQHRSRNRTTCLIFLGLKHLKKKKKSPCYTTLLINIHKSLVMKKKKKRSHYLSGRNSKNL